MARFGSGSSDPSLDARTGRWSGAATSDFEYEWWHSHGGLVFRGKAGNELVDAGARRVLRFCLGHGAGGGGDNNGRGGEAGGRSGGVYNSQRKQSSGTKVDGNIPDENGMDVGRSARGWKCECGIGGDDRGSGGDWYELARILGVGKCKCVVCYQRGPFVDRARISTVGTTV